MREAEDWIDIRTTLHHRSGFDPAHSSNKRTPSFFRPIDIRLWSPCRQHRKRSVPFGGNVQPLDDTP